MRFLRKRRELELRDLGGLVFDMYRFGSKRQDLVRDKLQAMFAADRELREFEQLLGRRPRRLDVREAGIGGACRNCQQLYSTEARFCSRCGQGVTDGARPDTVIESPAAAAPAPAAYSPAAEEPAHDPFSQPQAWQDSQPQAIDPQEDGGGRRFGRWRRKAREPEPRPAQLWEGAEAQPQAWQGVEPQTQAWQGVEPQTQAWQGADHTQAWQGAEPQTPDPASQAPGPAPQRPAPAPQRPAWQAPALQSQAAGSQGDGSGRRFSRRRRKTVGKGGPASEEAQRQQQEWEAQYQASVEAQRQAWQDEQAGSTQSEPEDETRAWQRQPPATAPEPGMENDRHDPAAPTEGGFSGLEAGDPLASRSGERRR